MENYTSDSSDSENSVKVIDYAYLLLNPDETEDKLEKYFDEKKSFELVEKLILHHNQLITLPDSVYQFSNTRVLDISNNGITTLPDVFKYLPLTSFTAKNNLLTCSSIPKSFEKCLSLIELNLSGNKLCHFPEQILDFVGLKFLYLGGNGMVEISKNIWKLQNLQMVSFGGNKLTEVPAAIGLLQHLQALVLCDNHIECLPANIANLHKLKTLLLHKNKLRTLPPEIVALKNLSELSLRDNPLIIRFVSEMSHSPSSLLELSARTIKLYNIGYGPGDIPATLFSYINSGHHCVNPHCKGVYFDNRVEHIKFVDFCGKYRIPLLQYLCSSKCANTASVREWKDESIDRPSRSYMMKKVLLG
ncbi:leucine-rich repeat-containing protein 58 [Diabrotica virgifera virgifera]|uniref:Leucine-rich repeat-containing protein 58 n=1 Tax=Diabrotica virgifera virgifera TaxID=50390 RepID=A0A6P7FWH7_DIAVI|nr:leucine-rich repeat-containing protein 58 [Diabrotica virgifera virgifera]XP_028136976.1 leucine-rich repeat-containing protein 58 [Diabrotica virgifera virgifera]